MRGILILLISVLIISCNQNKKLNQIESKPIDPNNYFSDKTIENSQEINGQEIFDTFLTKFYSDTIFQKNRIKYPLKGEIKEWHETEEFVVESNWTEKEIIILTSLKKSQTKIEKSIWEIIEKSESKVEKLYLKNSGFYIEREFIQSNGQWYLIRYDISNL